MAWTVVEDFGRGLDARRMAIGLPAGALATCTNAHINSGGEVEKCPAWVKAYQLPAQTFGMKAVSGQLYVFGSEDVTSVPSGVVFQRLQASPAQPMAKVHKVDNFNGKPYVIAEYQDGTIWHFYDGTRIAQWADSQSRASFRITGGTASAGVNKITSIKVNGVEVLNSAVDWTTTHADTAAAVAAQINSYASSPEYTATSYKQTVIIIAGSGTGETPNGFEVVVAVGGDVTVSAPANFSGGTDDSLTPGKYCLTFKDKMYSTSASILHFSKVGDPTIVQPADDGAEGAGFINMANHASGSEELTALGEYYGNLAIFAKSAVQVWSVDSDEANNVQIQTLKNTGTIAPKSVIPVLENDVLYLAKSGIRSLRSRDSSNAAYVADIGTPIDRLVTASLRSLPPSVSEAAVGAFEPVNGRFLEALGHDVWAYSNYPGSKIAAWSKYEPGFQFTDFDTIDTKLYARAGDAIYLLGGEAGDTYDASTTTVILPWLSAKRPDDDKLATSVNIQAEGSWEIWLNTNPRSPDAFVKVADVTGITSPQDKIALNGQSTHFQLKLVHSTAEYARVGKVSLGFENLQAAA